MEEQPQGDSFGGGNAAPGGGNPFAEALKRAREMAAGIQQMRENNGGAAEDGEPNLKRPYDDAGFGDQPAKKPMIDNAGPPAVVAGPAGPPGGPVSIDVAAAQAQVQAKAAQFLAQAAVAMPNSEEMMVPNRMVGVIIGRGGETINRLQNDSGARIQCAPPDPGNPSGGERAVTLTGSPEAIQSARIMIQALVDQGPPDQQQGGGGGPGMMVQPNMGGMPGNTGMPGGMPAMAGANPLGHEVYEQLIPQPKVGLIIGKGGETIKRLQEQAGCRMLMVQDGQYSNAPQRLLRIQGAPSAIEAAKGLVMDLIGGMDFNPGNQTVEVQVPSNLVGMVIGRGGESIKRIQAETGVRIQFQQDPPGMMGRPGIRTATLVGPAEGLPQAQKMVIEIIERGADGPGGQGGGGGGQGGRPPMMNMGDTHIEFPVPANRCGLVIGRGGETIRALQSQTGAHIQLNRNAQCGPDEKVFTIRGTREQVAHAQDLIREKCDLPPGPSGPGAYGQAGMQQAGMATPGMYPPQGQAMAQQQYAGYPMQQQQGYPQAGGPMPNDMQAQAQQAQAAWAAYYHQYYSQMAAAAAANPAAMGQAQSGAPTGVQQTAPGAQQAAPQVATTAAAGSQDLQAQWAEYYRQLGYAYPTPGQQHGTR